jgi:hypothetical protein
MNKARIAIVLIGACAVLLSACAPSAATPTTSASQSAGIAVATKAANTADLAANTSGGNAVSNELQLLLGTLKLQGTDLAVTSEQASTLLPLWTSYKAISPSRGPGQGQGQATPQAETDNSETQAQREALVKQIQAVMTADQLKAIAEMNITRETAMTIMQEQGIMMGGPQPSNDSNPGNGNPPPQGTPPANRGGDGGQGVPPNGQPPGNGQRPAGAAGGMVPPELIEALIQVLEKTSGE